MASGAGGTEMVRPSARHIASLDGFRGIAFLLVFVRHYSLTSHVSSPVLRNLEHFGQIGWVGVDLFFTLSGFLITGILLDTVGQPGYLRNFFARRALRIFPLYYTVFLVLLALTPLLHLQWHKGQLAYLFYAGNIAYRVNPDLAELRPAVVLFHLWSLAVEEQFYLIWPWVVLLVMRMGKLGSAARLMKVCLGLSAFALLVRAVLVWKLDRSSAYEWSYAMLPTHMDGLLYGGVAAAWVRIRPLEQIVPWARRICVSAAVVLAGVYCWVGLDFYSVPMMYVGFPAMAIFFTSILLQALQARTWAWRVGSMRVLRFFGRYSYGLYVYHILFAPLTTPLQWYLQRKTHSVMLGGLGYVATVFVGTCVLSVLSYELYEKQWLRLKRRFAYKGRRGGLMDGAIVS